MLIAALVGGDARGGRGRWRSASRREANGYYAAWADGPAWLAQMQTEQAALAKLWETDPWLSSSGG